MTSKRCTDCRHTKGIGYDFWCGEGHTEYEVFGAETNCPYYEYHDWSKDVPSMTDKRFQYKNHKVYDNLTGETHSSNMVSVNVLNELHEENQLLKLQVETKLFSRRELEKENEELKELLDYADDLIQSHLSEHFIRQWRNFKTGHKEYNDFWEEKLKKHKELKEDVE